MNEKNDIEKYDKFLDMILYYNINMKYQDDNQTKFSSDVLNIFGIDINKYFNGNFGTF
jgi:hypothetical protein